ncbi:MAG: PAS domain S-box protein [Burkholderiaceae bacterium]
MNDDMASTLDAPGTDSVELGQHRDQALKAVLLMTAVATPLTTLAIFWRDGWNATAIVAACMSVGLWVLWLLYRTRWHAWVAYPLTLVLALGSLGAIVSQGSVRSGGSSALLTTLVLASTFLSRAGVAVAAVTVLFSLGVLNHLEQIGALQPNLPPVDWAVWILHAACAAAILVCVLFSRFRLLDAFRRQRDAYQVAVMAGQDMRASRTRFKSLFESNPAATLVIDLDTRRVANANAAFERLFGYTADKLVNRESPEFWVDPSEHLAFRAALRAHGEVRQLRARLRCQDGSEIDALVSASIVAQAHERLLTIMALDMTAEEASRKALHLSEERFSKAFNFSPLGMTITRLSDGLVIEVNPANERVIGWAPDDLRGRSSMASGVWVEQADRDEYVQNLRRDGQLQGFATRMRSKRGDIVPVKVWAEIIEIEGESCALSFTMNVAAERRRQQTLINLAEGVSSHTGEAFFLSLAEHLAAGIGAEGVVVAELTGHNEVATLALMTEQGLQPNRQLPLAHTTYSRLLAIDDIVALDLGSRQLVQSTPPFHPDRINSMAGVALRDADGSPIGLLAVVWSEPVALDDETRALLQIFASRCNAELLRLQRDREILRLQATLEQRVHERTEQLQYLNQELESFSYSVSHDLKSPLRAIDGFMHLLQEQLEGRTTEDDDELIGRIQGSVNRMNGLINDLLALARVSQGQLQRTDVNLSELAKDVVRRERDRDPTREVEVSIQPDVRANCDPRMAHIVLENLIGNAWKYSRNTAGARIEFGASKDQDTGMNLFHVRDNGAGFDMARADRLFKPFTRLHTSAEFEGSGIGLATVRRIVERHGGQIRGEGAIGQGATFRFSFGNESA